MTNPLIRPEGTSPVSRRNFLRLAGLSAAALSGSGLLAACAGTAAPAAIATATTTSTSGAAPAATAAGSMSAGSATMAAAGTYGDIKVQLSWIKNIEFSGEYFADSKGYYKEAGFSSVTLVDGPTTTDSLVLAGKVDVGLSTPDATATLVSGQGATLKIIGSTYQKNPFCIMSLADGKPIHTLADLKGKKIGVQDPNRPILSGFLLANNIPETDVEFVKVGFETTELEQGQVDGHMSYLTNEPIVMKAKGKTPVTLGFADNGLALTAETFTVTEDTLANKRDMLKAFLWAEIKGWNDAIADPVAGAKMAVETYGKDKNLDLAEQTEEANAQVRLIVTADTKKNGIFTASDALLADITKALTAVGITDVTAADLFDLSLLEEVYAEHPELIVG
jgi:ABC-type nitrate/sulfonate/bicarbonate transport system substrate-binding protein